MPKIIQLMPTILYGDAVSNNALQVWKALKEAGYDTYIAAETIGGNLPRNAIVNYSKMPELQEDDILIYHLSIGTRMNYEIEKFSCRKVIWYHNITPPEFFDGYSIKTYLACAEGYRGLKHLADKADYCLADSGYNRQCLIDAGFTCDIDVVPILIPFDDYKKKPDAKVIRQYSDDGYTNILFVGRVSPNKKHEDLITAFHYYNKYFNPKSRLFLVGSCGGMEIYHDRLVRYIEKLGTPNVIFTEHVKFDEILAYYRIADLFLCLSEHEGFGVPLVEAMLFEKPILAYDCTAVGETVSYGGFVLKDKDPIETAGAMDYIITHDDVRKRLIELEQKRLQDFAYENVSRTMLTYIREYIEKGAK